MIMTMILLYNSRPELLALTTGNGNTNEDNVSVNNQRILKVAKRQDVSLNDIFFPFWRYLRGRLKLSVLFLLDLVI